MLQSPNMIANVTTDPVQSNAVVLA